MFAGVASGEDRDMVLDGADGDVTTNEYQSFIDKLAYLPPPPTNNIGNLMVDERDGARLHGMQTFYAFTHDRRDLDMAIVWSDAFLHARNDPINGRIIWTGKRDLCWPNKATNEVQALHSGAENGDVIEHIVNTARLILENPAVWNQTAPADRFGFGATYLDRAKTYVRECQRSAETTIVPWFVRSTKDGYRLYHPDSPAYFKCCGDSGPVPWNQQQELVGALLRLAQCHRLLNDGNSNIAYYEKITADTEHWFFATALPVSAHNRVCYLWPYVAPRDPAEWPEVITEADYDMFIFRAYQADLGPTRIQMQRLINTARFLMYLGTNRFAGKVDGTSNQERHDRKFLNFEWIEMSVLDRDFYNQVNSAVLTSHEYYDNLAVEAAVLSTKHYWATTTNSPAEIIEDASNVPPVPQNFTASVKYLTVTVYLPLAAFIWLIMTLSTLCLPMVMRARRHAPTMPRRLDVLFRLVNLAAFGLAIFVTCRMGLFFHVRHPKVLLEFCYGLLAVGLALQWIPAIYLKRVSIAGYAGSLLTCLALALSFWNWQSFLIIFVPACLAIVARAVINSNSNGHGDGTSANSRLRAMARFK
jgi:hypothetical protein